MHRRCRFEAELIVCCTEYLLRVRTVGDWGRGLRFDFAVVVPVSCVFLSNYNVYTEFFKCRDMVFGAVPIRNDGVKGICAAHLDKGV